jgi:hypothetical protein
MAYSPSTRIVQDVIRNVQRSFGDESGVQLQNADIFMWVNDACDEIVKRNRINKAKSSSSSISGQADYSFSTLSIMQVEAIHFGGQRIPNMSFAEAEEQVIGRDSVPMQGTPVCWYEWAGTFSFYPVPDSVAVIDIYYTAQPTRVVATTDLLPLPDKYYTDIVNYVLLKAYEMDEDPQMSQLKGQQFDASLAAMGEEEREAQNMTYPTITVLDFDPWS